MRKLCDPMRVMDPGFEPRWMVTCSRMALFGPMRVPEGVEGSKVRSWGSSPMMQPQPMVVFSPISVSPQMREWPPILTPGESFTGPSMTEKGPISTFSAIWASLEMMAVGWRGTGWEVVMGLRLPVGVGLAMPGWSGVNT